jgi:hypothetical protein
VIGRGHRLDGGFSGGLMELKRPSWRLVDLKIEIKWKAEEAE